MMRSFMLFGVVLLLILPLAGVTAQEDAELDIPILASGDEVIGTFSGRVTTQLYAFNASAGDVVTISMTQIDDALDPLLVLLGSAGQVLITDDDGGTEVIYSAMILNFPIPDDGTYYIVASDVEYIYITLAEDETLEEDLSYALTLDGSTAPSDFAPEEMEMVTRSIAVGDVLSGETTIDEPVAYFLIEAQAGDSLEIRLESDDFDPVLHVFDPAGNRIGINDDVDTNDSFNSEVEIEISEDGVYLIVATDVFFYYGDDIVRESVGQFTLSVMPD